MYRFPITYLVKLLIILIFLHFNYGCSSGCSDMVKGKVIAEKAVKIFHKSYNKSDYKTIYKTSNNNFRKSLSYEDFIKFISSIQNKLGKIRSTTTSGWKVNKHNFDTYVVVQKETKFANGKGTETFTFEIVDNEAVLQGYNINSMDLVLQ